jgi:hypothetical protein
VTLSQSSIISIKEFIDIEDCFVLVPDTFGRKLLESNEFKQTKTMTNKQVMKRILHLLVNKRDVIEKASDMLEDTANIISSNETLPNGNTYVKARFDLGCDGGQAIEGNVKWSVYPPYAYYAGEEYVKKWTALGKESWHQCTYPSQNDRTRNGVTYTHIIDNKTSTYVVGDGCGFWSDSLSVWRLYGRLEHDIRMSSVTRQRGLYYSNFTNKWVMARLNESGVPIYLVEGKDFKVDYIRNSTYGNKRWSDGIYHFKLSDYYKNNVKGTINNRWCIIPEPPNMDVQTNREVYTWYEARLMNDLYYDIDRNLAWFLTSYPNKYQEDTPWNVATHCHNGRIHEEMPCQVSITINASKEWKEFSPPCKNGIMYKNGPKVIFDSGGVICSIQATNNMQMQTSSTIRLGLETAYMLGATHINCIVNNNESSFSNCSDMNITEYQAINATLVSASNVIELVNYGTTIEYGSNKWDIYTILIIIGIIIIGGILLYVFIRYILPCIIPLICGKCLSKRRKDKKTEEELNP